MPITFAPAQPVAPEIAQAYGAAQASNANIPNLANLYESQARLAQQQNQANADRSAQYQSRNLDRMQAGAEIVRQDENQRQNRELAYQEHYARQQLSPRDMAQLQAAAEGRQQDAQLTDWLKQRQVSQQDVLERQKLDQATSWVLNDHEYLTPEMKKAALIQLKSKLDPITQREILQQEKEQKQRDANATIIEKASRGDYKDLPVLRDEQGNVIKDEFGFPSLKIVDPKTGKSYDFHETDKKTAIEARKLKIQEAALAQKAADVKAKETERQAAAAEKVAEALRKDYERDLEKKITAIEHNSRVAELKAAADGKPYTVPTDDAIRQQAVTELKRIGWVAPGVRDTRGGQATSGGYSAQGGQQQGEGEPPQPTEKPFDVAAPPDKLTVPQRVKVAQLDQFIEQAKRAPIPDQQRPHFLSAATQAKAALARYGSVANMQAQNPELFRQYELWAVELAKLPPLPAPPQQDYGNDRIFGPGTLTPSI